MIDLEQLQADYFDSDALREPSYKLYRRHINGKRYYYRIQDEDGSIVRPDQILIYPSWTEMWNAVLPTSDFLIKWIADLGWEASRKELFSKAAYGTTMHYINSKWLLHGVSLSDSSLLSLIQDLNESITVHYDESWLPELRNDVLAFAQFVRDRNVNPLAVEVSLCSDKTGMAGTIDIVAEMDFNRTRVTTLIDMKSGRKGFFLSHQAQLHGYKDMFEDNFDTHIDMLFNWAPTAWRTKPTYKLQNQTAMLPDAVYDAYLAIYNGMFRPDTENTQVKTFVDEAFHPNDEPSEFYSVKDIKSDIANEHNRRFIR